MHIIIEFCVLHLLQRKSVTNIKMKEKHDEREAIDGYS